MYIQTRIYVHINKHINKQTLTNQQSKTKQIKIQNSKTSRLSIVKSTKFYSKVNQTTRLSKHPSKHRPIPKYHLKCQSIAQSVKLTLWNYNINQPNPSPSAQKYFKSTQNNSASAKNKFKTGFIST